MTPRRLREKRLRKYQIPRARVIPPEGIYPVDEWRMVEQRFAPRFLAQTETIFSVANGYLGLRGDFEEGTPRCDGGALVNGFYESWPIVYGEEAYGFARTGQTIVDVPDGKIIRLYVDDEPFDLHRTQPVEYRRVLDMKQGMLHREIVWENTAGKRVRIRSTRLASIAHRHLAVVDYEVSVAGEGAHLRISSELVNERDGEQEDRDDPRRSRRFDGSALDPVLRRAEGLRAVLCHRTHRSRLLLACGMDHVVETPSSWRFQNEESENFERVVFEVDAGADEPFHLTKFIVYHHEAEAHPEELVARSERTLSRARDLGRERLLEEQRERLADFWSRSDVRIEGDPSIQQGVRFNLFQLLQATARVEGAGVPAKGLTGRGYEGHYFWDSEIYVMPFLIYTAPRVARSLLRFRYRMLDCARARAAELGHAGALFPWRTINGEEASAYYAAGTAQYHINADVMYAMRKYVQASGDGAFMLGEGAEMLVETARLWVDLGCYPESRGGAFCINGVTGPDEYTAVVNNNRFTNLMARDNLRMATRVVRLLAEQHPDELHQLEDATGLEEAEVAGWRRAYESMWLPVDEKTGIHPQDDAFLSREVWDLENTPAEHFPLLLHYHPLVLYRHQVIKQADVVLAMFLLEGDFSPEEMKRNFDYYDPLTTHDSSLSVCIQSIVATEIGYADRAFDYFLEGLVVDLADIGGNVNDGVHVASAGGVWMALVYGFGGMRDDFGVLSFAPKLPAEWTGLGFPIAWGGQIFDVDITPETTRYTLREGEPLRIRHGDRELELRAGDTVAVPTRSDAAA